MKRITASQLEQAARPAIDTLAVMRTVGRIAPVRLRVVVLKIFDAPREGHEHDNACSIG